MIHITCNMCSRDLPHMYALGPRALGIHIRQIPCAHITTTTCNSMAQHAKYSFEGLPGTSYIALVTEYCKDVSWKFCFSGNFGTEPTFSTKFGTSVSKKVD